MSDRRLSCAIAWTLGCALWLPGVARAAPSLDLAAAPAGHYVLDQRHASVLARVRHMGLSHYTLRFDQVDGAYDYDPARPLASVVTVTLDAHSLDVGDPKIAQQFAHQFLDADAYPKITFTSSALIQSDADHGSMTGDLTLRGVTRPITLQVTYDGTESGLIGGRRMGFSATGVVKRSDFGSKALQGPVGDDVELVIEAEFIRK